MRGSKWQAWNSVKYTLIFIYYLVASSCQEKYRPYTSMKRPSSRQNQRKHESEEKDKQTKTLNSFLILICLSVGLTHPLVVSQNLELVNVLLLASSWVIFYGRLNLILLAVDSRKDISRPLTSACSVGCRNMNFCLLCSSVQDFLPQVFLSHF